ncbi:hypothetical protein JTB14_020134 [Gonioctena quinquepunctata]|nr:hypothetical protein JTB14_020134 [Gonioctena quinquepunctata]
MIINNDMQPTVLALTSISVIDLIIKSPTIFHEVVYCTTADDTFGSDHFPILMEVRISPTEEIHNQSMPNSDIRYNRHKIDWIKFEQIIETIAINSYDQFIFAVNQGIEQSAPEIDNNRKFAKSHGGTDNAWKS